MSTPSLVVQVLYSAAVDAGALVRKGLGREVERVVKQGPGASHHSLMTQLDLDSQELIIERARAFPVWILAEEDCSGERVITDANLERLFDPDTSVCVIDSLDGTASAARRRWDWSVCAHVVRNNAYFGGAIVAPDVRGGFHVVAEEGRGAWLLEGYQQMRVDDMELAMVSPISELREANVLFGMDLPRRPEFSSFLLQAANQAQTCAMGGSCALGVAAVVAGRAEALIQTQQWPWDWVSAWMIQEAGGQVLWFHYRQGRLVQLPAPDQASYSRINRKERGGLGFIGGNPQVVNELWQLLQRSWAQS